MDGGWREVCAAGADDHLDVRAFLIGANRLLLVSDCNSVSISAKQQLTLTSSFAFSFSGGTYIVDTGS